MSKTPILTIDVADDQFKAFYELYNKYKGSLDDMPESWRRANEAMNAGVAALVEQTHNVSSNLAKAITAQRQFAKVSETSGIRLKGMAHSAKSIADSFFKVEKFVIKMGAWGLGLGAASLFGLDRLATSALSQARSARGIGVNTGQLRAFQTDYRQIAPANLPNSVYAAQQDYSKSALLMASTGLGINAIESMNPVMLSQILIQKAHDYYKQQHGHLQAKTAVMQGLEAAGLSVEDITRAGNTPEADIAHAGRQLAADRKRLDYTNRTLEGLWSFQRQLNIAGQALQTDLSKHLSKLGPSLGGLVTVIEKDAETLLNGLLSKHNVAAISDGINKFTKFLSSGEAMKDIKSFAGVLGTLATAMKDLAVFIEKVTGHDPDTKKKLGEVSKWWHASPKEKLHMLTTPLDQNASPEVKQAVARSRAFGAHLLVGLSHGPNAFPTGGIKISRAANDALADASKYDSLIGIAGATRALALTESSGRPGVISKAGALGLTQMMPGTAAAMGVTNWRDPDQNMRGGATYLGMMEHLAHSMSPNASSKQNIEMALAAYNWGPGHFEDFWKREQKKYGSKLGDGEWKHDLPRETQREIRAFMGYLPSASREGLNTPILKQIARNTSQPVKVTVVTETPVSARAAVQANAAH